MRCADKCLKQYHCALDRSLIYEIFGNHLQYCSTIVLLLELAFYITKCLQEGISDAQIARKENDSI